MMRGGALDDSGMIDLNALRAEHAARSRLDSSTTDVVNRLQVFPFGTPIAPEPPPVEAPPTPAPGQSPAAKRAFIVLGVMLMGGVAAAIAWASTSEPPAQPTAAVAP